jgi:hypothetical protein
MNTSTQVQRVYVLSLALAAVTGCSDSQPLGSLECIGDGIHCGFTSEQNRIRSQGGGRSIEMPSGEVSSTGLDVLMPTTSTEAFTASLDRRIILTTDANGDLWSVVTVDVPLVLSKLDRDGTVVEEHAIEPPRGARKGSNYYADIESIDLNSSRSAATMTVMWLRGCDGRDGYPPDCQLHEVLVFEDLAKAPRRIEAVYYPAHVLANGSGEWFLYDGGVIDKVDTRSNLVWRQTGLLSIATGQQSWNIDGALRADNKLSVLIGAPDIGYPYELWQLDSRGNIESRRGVAWGGDVPTYAIDARGRDVLAGMGRDGDLIMMRVLPDGSTEGGTVTRKEYSSLRPDGFGLDPEGAVYVTTTAGGREPNERRAVLCQLTSAGELRCFTLGGITVREHGPLIDELVAPEPGVVYVHSGSTLHRYELPAQ